MLYVMFKSHTKYKSLWLKIQAFCAASCLWLKDQVKVKFMYLLLPKIFTSCKHVVANMWLWACGCCYTSCKHVVANMWLWACGHCYTSCKHVVASMWLRAWVVVALHVSMLICKHVFVVVLYVSM